ncbi:disease resistance protein RPM1-like [Populus alba x Populus x berolinensis]|nr:disease resistance protein RPM1-like [Populus alba x Populus x berolinensis]
MAEGSVNLLLSKLAQILEEEGQLLTGIRTEAEYISDELEFMKAFLRVADAMEERDPRLEVLVKKRGFDYSVNLRARHQIASRIRAIKSRVIGISEAHRRYLIRNNIMGQGSTFSSISRLESQGDGLLLEEADLVGIEKPKRQLIEWLLERKSGREVVSVVGMGGLGKSTLKPGPKGVDSMDYDKLRTVINKFLQQKKYLIVLDDVWHTSAWGAFQHALPNISHEESWILFCKKIFQSNTCPPHLKSVSETILGRCEGLPLAIVSISGVLAAKDKNKIDEWEMVHRSLGAGFESNDTLMSTRKILSLSYNDLPYYLKSCLLYFSIFPAGNPIERMKLIRLWIAEGFVEGKEGMTLEEVADDYLNELIKRSLVRVVEATSDGRVKTCRIHDLLREIMITKAKDQDFVAIVKEEGMMWSEKVRRVSIHKAVPSIQRRHVASRLRSVLIFWGADSFPDSPAPSLSFGHLRLLNVLDLEGAPLKEFPSKVSSLFLLKYLSLRNTNVNSIPSSISKLLNLETLDLKQTQISGLPVGILKLRKLRHLLVYRYEIDSDDRIHTKYGFQPPPQIGRLQSLQKLCFVDANQGGDLLLELGRLNQLRRLGIVKFRKEHGKDLCSSVTKLTDLRALSITSITDSEFIDLEYLSNPPRFLQRLYLTGRLLRDFNGSSSWA